MAVAALESRILMSGTTPTIESLAFANPVANYGMVSGDFAGVLADATPASYYTIEIDTNNDQMSDVSGMTGSPGSFSSYGSMPLGTTSVQARAMEYDSQTGQYAYGDWQQFAVRDGVVPNTPPTIAGLMFANPSIMSGTVYGDFTGTLTDATPGSYY